MKCHSGYGAASTIVDPARPVNDQLNGQHLTKPYEPPVIAANLRLMVRWACRDPIDQMCDSSRGITGHLIREIRRVFP